MKRHLSFSVAVILLAVVALNSGCAILFTVGSNSGHNYLNEKFGEYAPRTVAVVFSIADEAAELGVAGERGSWSSWSTAWDLARPVELDTVFHNTKPSGMGNFGFEFAIRDEIRKHLEEKGYEVKGIEINYSEAQRTEKILDKAKGDGIDAVFFLHYTFTSEWKDHYFWQSTQTYGNVQVTTTYTQTNTHTGFLFNPAGALYSTRDKALLWSSGGYGAEYRYMDFACLFFGLGAIWPDEVIHPSVRDCLSTEKWEGEGAKFTAEVGSYLAQYLVGMVFDPIKTIEDGSNYAWDWYGKDVEMWAIYFTPFQIPVFWWSRFDPLPKAGEKKPEEKPATPEPAPEGAKT